MPAGAVTPQEIARRAGFPIYGESTTSIPATAPAAAGAVPAAQLAAAAGFPMSPPTPASTPGVKTIAQAVPAAAPPVMTPEQIAQRAGFAIAPVAGAVPNVSKPAAPAPLAAMKGPSAGTTELIPGATDWIRQLVMDALPSRSAQASAPMPQSPATVGAVTADRLTPATPSFFSRLGAAFGPSEPAYRPGGVRS